MKHNSGQLLRRSPALPSPAAASRVTAEPKPRARFTALARLLFQSFCRLEVEGAERLPFGHSFIVCSNHNSHLDSLALMQATAAAGNLHVLLAARDYFFDRPLRRWVVSTILPVVPIERRRPVRAIDDVAALLRHRLAAGPRTIIMFPEGTRSADGRIGRFKGGIGLLAQTLGVPIVPAIVLGTRDCLAPGRVLPRPGAVRVVLGETIQPGRDGRGDGWLKRSRWLASEAEHRVRQLAELAGA